MAGKKDEKKKSGFGAAFSAKARASRLDAMEAAAVGKKPKPKAKKDTKKK